jgi:hypothetical protein
MGGGLTWRYPLRASILAWSKPWVDEDASVDAMMDELLLQMTGGG